MQFKIAVHCLVTVLLVLINVLGPTSSEIISVTLFSAALATGGWYSWDTIKDNTLCKFTECCNEDYVPYDINRLRIELSKKLFGQPLVEELVNIISAHKETIKNKGNKKALVISLHGWTGVGKNYAATILAESLYKKGMHSKYVKLIMGEKDFDCTDIPKSKEALTRQVTEVVKKCPNSLIIIDEIHAMCPSVLDALKPMLDHHHAVDGVDYRDAIFIFIANTGGQEIATHLLQLYHEGFTRNSVKFHDFEPIIRRTAYYKGGFKNANAIAHNLIDHYIPFLPLEQRHVEMCARAEFIANDYPNPSDKMMEDALSIVTYGPTEDQPIFANNGCKRFNKQIPYIIQKHNPKPEKSEL